MYQSIYYDKNTNLIHLWDDEKGKLEFQFKKYAYVPDAFGDYTSMDGIKLKKVSSWDKESEKKGLVYEYDVHPVLRTLIDHYYDSDEISKNHRIMFLDIEVAKEGKYSEAMTAANTITAISYYVEQLGYVCLLLDPSGKIESGKFPIKTTAGKEIEVFLKTFTSETQLLAQIVAHFARIRPTIVSGWNSELYDLPYLYNRIQQKLGRSTAEKLSEIGIVSTIDVGKKDQSVSIAGVNCLDLMTLYKKFTPNEQPRYTLDAICKIELGRGKVQYSGDLQKLYETDLNKFIEYNVNDVELCVALNAKLDYIATAQGLCHKGHVPYEDFIFSSRYLDGASLVYCRRNNLVAMKTQIEGEKEIARGAFVKLPTPGLYKYVYDLDLSGMYPANIMTLNISPETKWGKVLDFDGEEFSQNEPKKYRIIPKKRTTIIDEFDFNFEDGEIETDDLRGFLTEKNLSISANGILYTLDKKGLVPALLELWGEERKQYRKIAAEKKLAGDLDGYQHYDRKQYVTKILGNSFYGYLLLYGSRFYDMDNGEATTTTGVQLIKQSMKIVDLFYNKKLGTENKQFVIYSDTDSLMIPSLPLIENWETKTDSELAEETIRVAFNVQSFVNKYYDIHAKKFHNVSSHKWNIKQEMVGRRAFWGSAKKRYAMWITNKNGLPFDEPEIKGFDVVRSNFPPAFRVFMKEIIEEILHDKTSEELNGKIRNYKHQFIKSPVEDILLPTGVKEMSKYKYGQKGTPVHVKSVQNYNRLLHLLNLGDYPEFSDGDKVVWGYLVENPYHFESIALKGYDDPPEIVSFVEKYIDREKIFSNALISKFDTIWEDLGWGRVELNENSCDFF